MGIFITEVHIWKRNRDVYLLITLEYLLQVQHKYHNLQQTNWKSYKWQKDSCKGLPSYSLGVIQLCEAWPSGFWICFLSRLTGWLKCTHTKFSTKLMVRAYSFWCYLIQLFFGFVGKRCFPEFSLFVFLCNECNPFFCRGIHVQLFIWRKISCPKSVCSLIPNDDKELSEVKEKTNIMNDSK